MAVASPRATHAHAMDGIMHLIVASPDLRSQPRGLEQLPSSDQLSFCSAVTVGWLSFSRRAAVIRVRSGGPDFCLCFVQLDPGWANLSPGTVGDSLSAQRGLPNERSTA
jgi:hypothetical protein